MIVIPGTGLYLGLSGAEGNADPLPENAIFLDQVHGNRIVIDPAGGESADGMVMQRGSGIPALRVADCLPVFAVWDDFTAAAHAGWRGLAEGIVENLVAAVDSPLRWLILGPCICGDCYSVGDDVREAVITEDPSGAKGHLQGKVDLRGSALRRVRKLCGDEFQLINMNECTLESRNLHSYRGDKTVKRNLLWLAEIERGEHIRQLNGETECNSPERRKN